MRKVMATFVPDAERFTSDGRNFDNMTRCHQLNTTIRYVPMTSSEKIVESYFTRLSAVGVNTIHPQAGVRLAYKSRRRLSCEVAVVRRAARKGLGGGRCIVRRNNGVTDNHPVMAFSSRIVILIRSNVPERISHLILG
jgi:hypothetical protein